MNIQDLKSNTTWQEASNTINNNNNKISLAIATLENATLKNKGYFTSVEKLNEAIPNPSVGSKAYVGTSEPYAIYIVENGVWVDSGYTGGDEIVANITTDRIEDGAVTIGKLEPSIQSLITNISKNASFAGIATPFTNPGTPDGPVFYIALHAGIYPYFSKINVKNGESVILQWNSSKWIKSSFKPMTDFNSVYDLDGNNLTKTFERLHAVARGTITVDELDTIFSSGIYLVTLHGESGESDPTSIGILEETCGVNNSFNQRLICNLKDPNTDYSFDSDDKNSRVWTRTYTNKQQGTMGPIEGEWSLWECEKTITTDRIEDGAVTTEKIATSAFDSTLSVSGKIAPADVVGGKLTELEGKLATLDNADVAGKGENWSTKTLSRVYKQGDRILVNISGNPTFAGTSDGQVFISLIIRRRGTSTALKTLYYLYGNSAFEPKEFAYTATEDCVVYIEGRWHTDENVRIEIEGSVMADISELKNDNELVKSGVSTISKKERTTQRLFYSSQLNFNNTTKHIEIGNTFISSPTTTNTRIEIPAQNVDYTFDSNSTTLPLLVYDLSTSGYKTTTIQQITSNMYVLASISITGKGTSSIVHKVYYSAVADCRIDGINAEIKAEDALAITKNINAVLDIQDLRINPTPKFIVGTNYNNNIGTATDCIADETYYKVYPNSTIKIDLAEGWLIRIVQCNARKENLKGTDKYTALTEKLLRSDTEYIRFAVQNPNYSPTNPISLDVIDNDTCKLYQQESKRLVEIEEAASKIEEISKLPDVIFGSDINFGDYKLTVYDDRSGKWASGSSTYNGIFIPVRKGYKIKIIANPNYRALYSQVKEYGVSGQPVLYADGFEDRVSVEKGATSIFEILDTCKYLWVANMSDVDHKPSYIGFESIGGGQPVIEDIFTRNKHKEAQVLCAGYGGDDIKHFGFIHASDIHTRKEDYKCFESMCKFLQHYDNLKCAIVTGDLVYDHFASPIDYYNKGLEQTTKPVYNVIGNHDAGQQNSTTPSLDRVSSDGQCYEKYIAPYIGNWEVKSDGGGVPHPSGKSYYFNDFTAEKVRLIVVCEFETDYELSETDPEHELKWSREYRAMHQEQINWLIDSLSTTPSGYGVIVALHQLDTTKEEYNEFVSGYLAGKRSANIYTNYSQIDWFVRILDAFQKHTTLNFTFEQTGAVVGTMTVNADFTNKTDVEFICTLCGHTHNDYIGHYKDTNLVVLNIGSNNTTYTGKICPRKVGTIAEDLFNVVNVDRNRKKITIIRIGSDSSIEGQDRSRITINY